jgi:restriction endonuclease Mrr
MTLENNNNAVLDNNQVNDGAQHQEQETANTEKTFTQSELDSIIEKRLSKERAKWEKKVKEEADEAARMAKMSEAEKQEALFIKRVQEFEEREAAFNKAQAALQREKMLNETNKQLSERGLPLNFAEHIMADTAENTLANIDAFEKEWQAAINKAVDSKLRGSTPTSPVSKSNTTLTRKDIAKMSLSELSNLARTNPELYNQLTKK